MIHPLSELNDLKILYNELKEGEKKEFQQGCLLAYIASGKGILIQDKKQMKLEEGKSIFVVGSVTIIPLSESLSLYLLVCEEGSGWLIPFQDISFSKQSPVKMTPIWKELIKIQQSKILSDRCRFQSLIWTMLSMITDQSRSENLEEANQYVREHLHEPMSVAELADRFGMTPSSFARAFRQKFGVSPKEFIHNEKMKLAKKLMVQEKGLPLREIALRIGLQDEFYFSRLFKKREGVAPTIFIKRVQKRVAVISQLLLQDHLLALGIQPVAAPMYPSAFYGHNGLPSYLSRELEGTLLLNAEEHFNREEVLKAHPDLIIKTPLRQDAEQSALWTQQVHVHHIPFQTTWDAYLRKIAHIVEEKSKVEHIIYSLHQLEKKAKERLCRISGSGKWVVIWVRGNEIRLYGKTGHAFTDLFFRQLGFEPDDHIPDIGYEAIQIEELAYMNPARILILWSHVKDVQNLVNNRLWKTMKASRERHVYYPDSIEWDPWGPFGRKYMIERMVQFFLNSNI